MQSNARRKGRVSSAAVKVGSYHFLILAGIVSWFLLGCSGDPVTGDMRDNQPPKVWLSSAPPEGTTEGYQLHLYWGGWDPDGTVSYFEYVVTDNETGLFDLGDTTGRDKWRRVYAFDSTFAFSADILQDSSTTDPVTRFARSHTFFIRAIDDKGRPSAVPAYRSFTTWTLSPTVQIQIPKRVGINSATLPAISTYRWTATDYINGPLEIIEPDSVRWILKNVVGNDYVSGIEYIRNNPNAPEWTPWSYYRAPGDSGTSWTTPPTDFGNYVFAVQVKDEAGAVTPVFDESSNVRRVTVTRLSTGPVLTVTNRYVGALVTSVASTPTSIIDMPAGVPIGFSFMATARHYGGAVAGYRYGWDIADLADDDLWEVDYTPFTATWASAPERTFFFGSHTFNVEVIDNSGAKSRIEVKVNIVNFSMNKDLLLVDDFLEPESATFDLTLGATPSDQEHDDFWQYVLGDLNGFNSLFDMYQPREDAAFPLTRLVDYKTVIWDAWGGWDKAETARPIVYDLIKYRSKKPTGSGIPAGKIQPNYLSLYMAAGGRLLLCGVQPLTQVIDRGLVASSPVFPFLFRYELDGVQTGRYDDQLNDREWVGDESFGYREACVNHIDISYTNFNALRRQRENGCDVFLLRSTSKRDAGLRECLPLEPGFPTLRLRPEVAGPGRHYDPAIQGIAAEIYNAPYFSFCRWSEMGRRSCLTPIYGHGNLDTAEPIFGAPVAAWSSAFADKVSDSGNGTPSARSAFWGFEPVYFEPDSVRVALGRILFDEWKLPRKSP